MYSEEYEDYLTSEFNRTHPGLADLEKAERRSRDCAEFDFGSSNPRQDFYDSLPRYTNSINIDLFIYRHTKRLGRAASAIEVDNLTRVYCEQFDYNYSPFYDRHGMCVDLDGNVCKIKDLPF